MADTPKTEKPKRARAAKTTTGKKSAAKTSSPAPTSTARSNEAAPSARKSAPAKRAPARTPRTTAKATAKPHAPAAPRKPATAKARPAASAQPVAASPRSENRLPEIAPRTGILAALGTLAAVGGAFFVWRASRAEEPDYQVIESDGAIEIRKYPAIVTARAEARGERQAALSEGFRTLADYIFAKSRPGSKLPMTAPVLSDTDKNGSWRTRFVMPTGKARASLPAPPAGIELTSEPPARIATIRFAGRGDDATLMTKEGELRSWLHLKGLPHEGRAVHAYYNAPFLPGPLRRNEVMIELSNEGGVGA